MAVTSASFQVLPGDFVELESNQGLNVLTFTSPSDTTSSFVFGDQPIRGDIEDVTLEIGSAADGGGQDSSTRFLGEVDDLHFIGNEADNDVRFWRDVSDTYMDLGDGADQVSFRGDIDFTFIDLGGPDGAIDEISISDDSVVQDLIITGADQGDVLNVGGDEYTFDSTINGGFGGFVDDEGNILDDDEITYL